MLPIHCCGGVWTHAEPAGSHQSVVLHWLLLQVEIEESGEGQGGYAKEMSKEFIEAEVGGGGGAGQERCAARAWA